MRIVIGSMRVRLSVIDSETSPILLVMYILISISRRVHWTARLDLSRNEDDNVLPMTYDQQPPLSPSIFVSSAFEHLVFPMSISLLHQFLDMLIEPPSLRVLSLNELRPSDLSQTSLFSAKTLERRIKLPFRARVEECQIVSCF